LDREGFSLGRQATSVSAFEDDDEIRAVYYPEMAALLRRVTGAREAVVFDHNVRIDGAKSGQNSRMPVRAVHNDYTERSGPQRVREVMGDVRAKSLLKRRFAIINVWRSIAGPVQASPLGLVDAGSVRPSNLIPTDLVYPDRVGEIYEVSGNAAHRWYYYPLMREDEVLFIKGYDSRRDVARFTPHTAFDDPGSSVDAPPRQSVEIRALVFY
ncbi:MAG TPA: CmcJ/NvfI family oxidoreductase, partial [Arenicellales bacterium]|nr:CmcJ/NvfI family oxidoreductase [Arenicellales bacterium]